jgi:recombination protein RecA
MPSASAIRLQIESALAARIPAALTPVARVVRPVAATGIAALDETLHGGLPLGAITELIGPECSGRTSVALAFVAGMTQAGRVCAWIDVSNALDSASAAAAGVDLRRLLWVRCGAAKTEMPRTETPSLEASRTNLPQGQNFALPERYLVPPPSMKGLHGGGCGGHPRGEVKGMAQAVSGLLHGEARTPQNIALKNMSPRCAEPLRRDGSSLGVSALKGASSEAGQSQADRKIELSTGKNILQRISTLEKKANGRQEVSGHDFSRADKSNLISGALAPVVLDSPRKPSSTSPDVVSFHNRADRRQGIAGQSALPAKPWSRLEQALRVADLLLQGGGFSAIVLDMGSLAPEVASRVPLATWFRYRAAAESTHASVLLLAQYGCAKSSAELTLKLAPGDALSDRQVSEPTVFTGMAHTVEVARRRFTGTHDHVVPLRKPVQRANVACWQSYAAWAGVR